MDNKNLASKIEQVPVPPKPEVKPEDVLIKTPETGVENLSISKLVEKEGAVTKEKSETAASVAVAPAVSDDYHAKREKEIDAFLSEGLSETFLAMPPVKQKKFKEEGEKTAKQINLLLDAAKINLGKIINLIRRWLSLITGVNRFFLDQEAKIKADKIVKIKNKF